MLSVLKSILLVRSRLHWAQFSLVALTLLVGALCTPAPVQQSALSPQIILEPQPQATVTVATTPVESTPGASKAVSGQVTPPQDCTPAPAHILPAPLNLAAQPNGLTQVKDMTSYYQIYGNTPAQIQTQLKKCAPNRNSGFAAETGYSLTWQYSSTVATSGLCTLSSVKIGLHINMILPQWTPTASAVNGLAGSWHNLSNDLAAHENGHALLDQQHAAQLLNDLQTLPATDCRSIVAVAAAKAAAAIADLNAANNAYDAHTDHDIAQGTALAKS